MGPTDNNLDSGLDSTAPSALPEQFCKGVVAMAFRHHAAFTASRNRSLLAPCDAFPLLPLASEVDEA